MEKTNVIRLLEQRGVMFDTHTFSDEITNGEEVAIAIGLDPDKVFKTLVTVAANGEYFVFVIPVKTTLNLKKAALAANVKSIEMIKQKDLLPLTGYVHGGCSPMCMKKPFQTFIEETSQLFDSIAFSAGRRGLQVDMSPLKLAEFVDASFADLI